MTLFEFPLIRPINFALDTSLFLVLHYLLKTQGNNKFFVLYFFFFIFLSNIKVNFKHYNSS